MMPSSHLILCRPLLLLPPNPSQHQSLFQWVNSSHEVAKAGVSASASFPPKKSQGWSPSEYSIIIIRIFPPSFQDQFLFFSLISSKFYMSSWMFLSRNIVGHWLMDLDGFILGSQSRPHFLGKYYPAVISGRLSLKPLAHHRPRAISEATRTISAFFICACVLSCFSHVWLFANLWTIAHQTPLSMGFSKQRFSSGLPCPPPGDLPNPD